jgi:enolase
LASFSICSGAVVCEHWFRFKEVIPTARSSAPSGASTGSEEAYELRDKDPKRFGGKGTITSSGNVCSKLSPAIAGQPFSSLKALDDIICKTDGTDLKTNIGGNACTATSFALAESATSLFDEQLFLYLAK